MRPFLYRTNLYFLEIPSEIIAELRALSMKEEIIAEYGDIMKRKILLVTLEGTINYGNRLQHFALQTVIENLDYEVDSLLVLNAHSFPRSTRVKNRIKLWMNRFGVNRFNHDLSVSERAIHLGDFNNEYISHVIRMPVERVRQLGWTEYYCAVTGSDQVWHNWRVKAIPDELSYFYLDFMPIEKRISYAPSFGFTEFPEADIEAHKRGLNEMRALSCREQEGCELIEKLIGRKAEKVLDPTLLLTAEEWLSQEKKPRFHVPDHYMIQFFLGDLSADYQEEITRISVERKLTIINLQNVNDPLHYGLSPLEFIWMIHHADIVCTDSFHASVFSILFERNLRVFERISPQYGNMFGRLHDLLEPLGLMENVYEVGNNMSTILTDNAKTYLEHERQSSIDYLRRSLQESGTEWPGAEK